MTLCPVIIEFYIEPLGTTLLAITNLFRKKAMAIPARTTKIQLISSLFQLKGVSWFEVEISFIYKIFLRVMIQDRTICLSSLYQSLAKFIWLCKEIWKMIRKYS